jgi:hypothetical protein
MTITPSDFLPKDRDAAVEMIAEAIYEIADRLREGNNLDAIRVVNDLLDLIENEEEEEEKL